MAYTPVKVRATLPSSLGTGYTAPAGGAFVKSLIFCVQDGGARTITLKMGGKFVFKTFTVPFVDGRPFPVEGTDWLASGELVEWNADNASGVDVHLTVAEKS